jgi:hypothetical protein
MRLAAAWLLLCGSALAAENVRLIYVREPGAESCPDEGVLKRAVSARLGYDPFIEGHKVRSVRAVLGPQGRWLRASIELRDADDELLGTNQLTPRVRDCDILASAVELAIALAIDPLRASGASQPPPSPVPEPVLVTPPPPPTLVLRRAPRRALNDGENDDDGEDRAHLTGHLAVLAAVGSAPQATWGIEVGLAARWKRFSIGGELRGDTPGSRVIAGGTVSSSLATATFLPCVRAYGCSFCGLLSVGVLIGYGSDFTVDRRVILPYAGGGTRAAFEFRLTRRLSMGAHADLLASFTRALLRVDEQEVFHAPPVSGAFGVQISGVLR